MNRFRSNWFNVGGLLVIPGIILLAVFWQQLSWFQSLLWVNLLSLFLHQMEEYQFPGTFPFMLNKVMFASSLPDRFPLNTNTAMFINVSGWLIYFFAAVFAQHAKWLALITIMVSLGNFIAHTFLFNIKGKTIYNAGMLTSWLLFLPTVFLFFEDMVSHQHVSVATWAVGLSLGLVLNFAILVSIRRFARKHTKYIFKKFSANGA